MLRHNVRFCGRVTNLTKTAVISVKYCQRACFLMPEKLQNYINEEKGKEKKALVALLVFL